MYTGKKMGVYWFCLLFFSSTESESGGFQAAQPITGGDIAAAIRVGEV